MSSNENTSENGENILGDYPILEGNMEAYVSAY